MLKNTRAWTKSHLDKERESIKRSLLVHPESSRARAALRSARELEEDLSPISQMRRFIHLMFALIFDASEKSLKPREIEKISEVASAILRLAGIHAKTSRLSFLHRDLHTVVANLYRANGEVWRASWEQFLAYELSGFIAKDEAGFRALTLGISMSRLGYGEIALRSFEEAERSGLGRDHHFQARVMRIKLLRLSGSLAEAISLIEKTRLEPDCPNGVAGELEWETLCCDVTRTQNLSPMISTVKRSKALRRSSYFLDAFLWSRAVRESEWCQRYPTIRTLARDPQLKFQALGLGYKIVLAVTAFYDDSLPIGLRIERAGKVMLAAQQLQSVERELLAWAALTRWLARTQKFDLATLSLEKYRALSLGISGGANDDALNSLSDLISSKWFASRRTAPSVLKAA